MINKISFNEKIFLAGANGMVGRAIKRSLLKTGYGLKSNGGNLFTPSRKELDLTNINEVNSWFLKNKPSIVIIAAAKVGGILANSNEPTAFILDNLKIQTNIIECAWKYKVKRLLFLGSSCIYPKFSKQPIEEESLLEGQLEETNQWYAIAKISGIKLCEALRKEHGFDAISVMPTNLYGPGDNYHPLNSHVMASFIRKFYEAHLNSHSTVSCWGTGNPYREFLHVDDLADAIIFLLEKWDPNNHSAPTNRNGQPIYLLNVGSGKEITISNLASKISNIIGYKGKILWDKTKPDGTPRKLLDISKIKSLGWEPKISLEHGISATLRDFIKEHKN